MEMEITSDGWYANEWCTAQCPVEKCRNDEAYWFALQIRSADEPMTNFYKVRFGNVLLAPLSLPVPPRQIHANVTTVHKVRQRMARIAGPSVHSFYTIRACIIGVLGAKKRLVCFTIYPTFSFTNAYLLHAQYALA